MKPSSFVKSKFALNHHYDKAVLEILERSGNALSLEGLSILSGIRRDRLCKVIRTLEKFGKIEVATEKRIKFYRKLK